MGIERDVSDLESKVEYYETVIEQILEVLSMKFSLNKCGECGGRMKVEASPEYARRKHTYSVECVKCRKYHWINNLSEQFGEE